MGRIFFSFENYEAKLNERLARAMQNPESRIQVNARAIAIKNAEERVYNVYPNPGMEWSRRYNHNGLLDPSTYKSKSSTEAHHNRAWDVTLEGNAMGAGKGFTTYISAEDEWQQRFGGQRPHTSLAEVIENSNIYHAPPRRWMRHAEQEYGSKHFEKDLVLELESDGF